MKTIDILSQINEGLKDLAAVYYGLISVSWENSYKNTYRTLALPEHSNQ